MKRMVMALSVVGLGLALVGSAAAQTSRPATILRFVSDAAPVTVEALEEGELTITLAWHVVHIAEGQELVLRRYRDGEWERLLPDEALPPVGDVSVSLEHPGTFGPPTYRLEILDELNRVIDERTLLIPYADEALQELTPTIVEFSTTAGGINAAALAASTARVEVAWEVADRVPLSNLVFEQVMGGDQSMLVELPRRLFWVPSKGAGPLAPTVGSDASQIVLRLRVVDVISGDVYDEALLTVPVLGTAMPPSPQTAPTEAGTEPESDAESEEATPAPTAPTTAGDLAILTACEAVGDPETRGWVEAPGVASPAGDFIAYVSNAVGEATLVIVAEDGTGQREFGAPNPALPIGPRVRWSPSGDRLAFSNIVVSQPGGGYIYVLDVDDFEVRQVASYVGYYDDLAWSEDEASVYFTSGFASGAGSDMRVSNYEVFRIDAEGFGAVELIGEGCAVRAEPARQ